MRTCCDNTVVGKYERYFKEFWFDGPALPKIVSKDSVLVQGIDYPLFKLFHLSVLWRAHVSTLPEFSNVNLGPYVEKLRKMVLLGDPGPEEAYPIYGSVIVLDNGEVIYDLVTGPSRSRLWEFTAYFLCYAGCEGYFIVTEGASEVQKKFAIRKNAPFELAVRPLAEANSVRIAVRGLHASRSKRREP